MKSIFRKIAFVLALAMVVTLFPVMSASAAVKDNKYARKKNATLYVGGDVDGDYQSCWAAQTETKTWMKEEGYKSSYKTSNEDVVTVSKYGFVEAVGVGTAEITATFSKKGEKDIVESFNVTVKKIASSIALDKESQEALAAGLNVDDTITLKATMLDADGSSENISDTIKFYCSSKEDKEIIQLDSNTGELKALKEGKATILVRSYQWEYDRTAKKKVSKVTAEKPYEVEVTKNSIDVLQTAWNKFSITFPDTASAEAAVKATLPSLSQENAPVSEDKNVVKVFEVLGVDSSNRDIENAVYIKNISNNGNVVTVEMFNELKEETTYNVRYLDYDTAKFETCKNVAKSFKVDSRVGERTANSVEKKLFGTLYAEGKQGQDVDITGCKTYENWWNSVVVEDTATAFSPEYAFYDIPGDYSVWFHTTNAAFAVRLKASFDDWYVLDNNKVRTLTDPSITVTAGDTTITSNGLDAWGIVPVTETNNKYDTKQLAVGDSGYRLAVRASVTQYGQLTTKENALNSSDINKFTFKSSNDDKLSVNEQTGEIYPPKTAVDRVLVHVFYEGTFIGSCDVTVVGKRVFASVHSNTSTAQLAYGVNFVDEKGVKVSAQDQFGAIYRGDENGSLSLNVAVANSQYNNWLEVNGKLLTDTGVTVNNDADFTLKVTSSVQSTARTIRIVVTGTYTPYNSQNVKIERKAYFDVRVKNTSALTKPEDIRTYDLVKSDVDVVLKKGDNTNVANKEITISAYSVDREGFRIEKLNLSKIMNSTSDSAGSGNYAVLIRQGNNLQSDISINGKNSAVGFTAVGGDIKFKAVAVGSKTLPVSGSAVTISGSVIEVMPVGSYSINLFRDSAYVMGTVVSVRSTQDVPEWHWKANVVDVVLQNPQSLTPNDKVNIADAALDLFFDINRDGSINFNNEKVIIHDADVVMTGNSAYIRTVTYYWEVDGAYYEFIVGVNRAVTVR